MNRITRGISSLKKLKKIFDLTQGYRKINKTIEQIKQSLYDFYLNCKLKKRVFRKSWIVHITSGSKNLKTKYSLFLGKLRKKNIFLNRKILSFIIYKDFNIFNFLIKNLILICQKSLF